MMLVMNKWLAGLLTSVMVFTLLPVVALAEESGVIKEQTAVEQVQTLIDELTDADTITA